MSEEGKVFVTGASGFVGNHLILRLKTKGKREKFRILFDDKESNNRLTKQGGKDYECVPSPYLFGLY